MSSIPCARPAAALLAGLPGAASACVGCRQAALSAVFSDGFLGTLLMLLMPVGLLLAVGIAAYRLHPAAPHRTGDADGR